MQIYSFSVKPGCSPGKSCLEKLGDTAAPAGNRAIVIADSLMARSQVLSSLNDGLQNSGVQAIQSFVSEADSFAKAAEEIIRTAKAGRCQTVIGVGGMRTLAIAKCVAALAREAETIDPYLDGKVPGSPPLSYIAVPTTARDPFSCTDSILMIDPRNNAARLIGFSGFFTEAAFFDPDASASLSENYFSAIVLEIILSAVEGCVSQKKSLFTETLLEKAFSAAFTVLKGLNSGQNYSELIETAAAAGHWRQLPFLQQKWSRVCNCLALNGNTRHPKLLELLHLPPLIRHPGLSPIVENS